MLKMSRLIILENGIRKEAFSMARYYKNTKQWIYNTTFQKNMSLATEY